MKLSSKGFFYGFLGVLLGLIVLLSALNFWVDPYQFYRKNEAYLVSKNLQFRNPGLAKNYEYETVILGTSIAHAIRPTQVDSVYNTKTMKLTLTGSTMREQFLMGTIALNTGQVKHVIWGVDYFTATRPYTKALHDDTFPFYLYDDNFFNDWNFLFNISNLELTFETLMGGHRGENDWNQLDKQYTSGTGLEVIMKRHQVDSYDFPGDLPKIRENLVANIDHNLYELIVAHPEVEFDLYLPPYTILFFESDRSFERNSEFKLLLWETLGALSNVRIHDFQADERYSWDFNRYFDTYHHHPNTAIELVAKIKEGNYILDQNRLQQNNIELSRQREAFEIEDFWPADSATGSVDLHP